MPLRIRVIGVGKMGLPMARHFHAAGHQISVEDPDEARLELARAEGLAVALSTDSADDIDVVWSSLPDDAALLQVGREVAARLPAGRTYVDTSTVSPEASARVGLLCEVAGVDYLRATVSGNNRMAEAAQLTVMASGPRAAYDRVLPLLRLLGPGQFYLGEGEQARLMKLVVNLMIAQTSAMLAEALTLGRKGGLAWDDLWAVLNASAVASPIVKAKSVQLSRRDFTPTFTVHQMIKDLQLILAAGAESHVALPQAAATLQLMHAAVAQGDGALDYAAIIRAAERAAGMETDL